MGDVSEQLVGPSLAGLGFGDKVSAATPREPDLALELGMKNSTPLGSLGTKANEWLEPECAAQVLDPSFGQPLNRQRPALWQLLPPKKEPMTWLFASKRQPFLIQRLEGTLPQRIYVDACWPMRGRPVDPGGKITDCHLHYCVGFVAPGFGVEGVPMTGARSSSLEFFSFCFGMPRLAITPTRLHTSTQYDVCFRRGCAQTDRPTDRDRETERQRDRETERHRCIGRKKTHAFA